MSLFDTDRLQNFRKDTPTTPKPKVMIVDDEVGNRAVLYTALKSQYDVVQACNGREALSLIEQMERPEDIALIISDQRMPEMTGTELFHQLTIVLPRTLRILLTAYGDIKVVKDSINLAKIYKFILKPFDTEELMVILKQGVNDFESLKELDEYHCELELQAQMETQELALKNLENRGITKSQLIQQLALQMHPAQGGYYRRTYESRMSVPGTEGDRKLVTSIYYMLTDDQPYCYLHQKTFDTIHYYHLGASIRYWIISPEGHMTEAVLGPDILSGQKPLLMVKGGDWVMARQMSGEFGLLSEAAAPGFDYADNPVATLEDVETLFPDLMSELKGFIKP